MDANKSQLQYGRNSAIHPPPARMTIALPHPKADRLISLATVGTLHVAASLALLGLVKPTLLAPLIEPLHMELVTATPPARVAPTPPQPMPPKATPRNAVRQASPKPLAPPVLQTTAPAAADTPVILAAPAPKEAPVAPVADPQPETRAPSAPAASTHSEPVVQARFDADYLNNPAPEYPRASRSLSEEGRVLLRVQVGEDGRPLQVLLDTSSGFARLDRAAREAVARWRFVPARQGQQAVTGWVKVPVVFELNR
jgi:protein TonB